MPTRPTTSAAAGKPDANKAAAMTQTTSLGDRGRPQPPVLEGASAAAVDLASESVAGEEDPGAALDLVSPKPAARQP